MRDFLASHARRGEGGRHGGDPGSARPSGALPAELVLGALFGGTSGPATGSHRVTLTYEAPATCATATVNISVTNDSDVIFVLAGRDLVDGRGGTGGRPGFCPTGSSGSSFAQTARLAGTWPRHAIGAGDPGPSGPPATSVGPDGLAWYAARGSPSRRRPSAFTPRNPLRSPSPRAAVAL